MAKSTWAKGIPLDDALQARLRALVRERGEEETAAFLGIGRVSVMRAAAGYGLRRGTVFVIETKLAELRTRVA